MHRVPGNRRPAVAATTLAALAVGGAIAGAGIAAADHGSQSFTIAPVVQGGGPPAPPAPPAPEPADSAAPQAPGDAPADAPSAPQQ